MAHKIVVIHGLSNKPDKQTLAGWYDAAIQEGLAKNSGVRDAEFDLVMCYWADLLYKYPQHHDHDFHFDSLYNNQPYVEARLGVLRAYKEGWLDAARAVVSEAGGALADTVRGYVGLDAMVGWLLERTMRDLAFYYDRDRRILGRDGRSAEARRVLMDELTNTLLPLKGERLMLIAHSMGSIISYDVLRDLGRRDRAFPVHHYVTIGSPLGMPHVKANIHRERSYTRVPVRTPTIVTERWVNYADRSDPVAIDTHLGDDFGPNDAGIRVEDDLVLNDYVSPVGEKSAHKSYGYLRTPELSNHIREFLGA